MINILLILSLIGLSSQEYIKPFVAAHRGMCYILPENTLQSFNAALYAGTDYIELDVVLTKHFEVLVSHDPYLSDISNVANKTEFLSRKRARYQTYFNSQIIRRWQKSRLVD